MSTRTPLPTVNERDTENHSSVDGHHEPHTPAAKSGSRQSLPRCRNSVTSTTDEQPHVGNYRLLKTIGKGNFAKVKLARHVLTGREVSVPVFPCAQSCPVVTRDSPSHLKRGNSTLCLCMLTFLCPPLLPGYGPPKVDLQRFLSWAILSS
uniref:Protein kinase domain-containing protein n=1 Tax=Paramormyrops kingsleyae TaxID=1676925 RepID=A0A3B3QGA1_9TELE